MDEIMLNWMIPFIKDDFISLMKGVAPVSLASAA